MTRKSTSVTDLFSTSRFPSALQTEIFLPSQKSNSRSSRSGEDSSAIHEDRLGDDNESLIDLEQWALDIRDGKDASDNGRENAGYISDNASEIHSDSHVIVQVHKADSLEQIYSHSTSTLREEPRASTSKTTIEKEYDTPDMIYAKINKYTRVASSSNVSINIHSDDDNARISRRVSFDDSNVSKVVSESGSVLELFDKELKTETDSEVESKQESLKLETMSSASIEGALYSKVRSLTPRGSTRGSPFGSNFSLRDAFADETKLSSLTLKAQTENKNEAYHDSENESDLDHEYFVTQNVVDQSNEYYTADGIPQQDQEKSLNGELDLSTLEVKLQELQKRQTSLGVSEVNTFSSHEEHGTFLHF